MSDWDEQNLDQGDDYDDDDGPLSTSSSLDEMSELELPSRGYGDDRGSLFTWPLIAAAGLALVAGLTLFWLFSSRGPVIVPQQETLAEPPTAIASEAEPESASEPEPGAPEVTLPPLAESDAFVREALGELSRHPALASFLLTDELARKIVAAVANIAEGENPARHFPYLAPEDPFDVIRRPAQLYLDPRSYHRYDALAAGFASLDADGLAAAYRTSKPLLDEAYAELGYPNGPFEDALTQAISILLRTPVVEGRIGLYGDSVNYTFVDARLEALSPAQKQLLRAGPENTQEIQSKLREIAAALALPITS